MPSRWCEERQVPLSATDVLLVVEDEAILRMMAVDMFEDAGFTVLEAASGEQALALLRTHAVAGIFTDVDLSGSIDGFSLARIVHDQHPDAAIIVVSGYREPQKRDLPPEARFVSKPYDLAAVIETLHEMLPKLQPRC